MFYSYCPCPQGQIQWCVLDSRRLLSARKCMWTEFLSFLLYLYPTPTPWNHQFGLPCIFYLSEWSWLMHIYLFLSTFLIYVLFCFEIYLILFHIFSPGIVFLDTIYIATWTFNLFLLTVAECFVTVLFNRTFFNDETFLSILSKIVAAGYKWLLSTWSMAGVTKDLNC